MKRIIMMLMLILSFTVFADSEYITHLSDAGFQKDVIESDIPVLVDFWAPWCGPCKKLGPIFEELASEHHKDMKFAKLNVDNNRMTAGKYGIRSIPTVAIFKDGKPVDGFVGLRSKEEIRNIIRKHFPVKKEAVKKEEVKDLKPKK